MDNTQDILHALEQRLAAQDTRYAKMEEMMCNFMEKTMTIVQNGPTTDQRAVGSDDTSPQPSQQSHQRTKQKQHSLVHPRQSMHSEQAQDHYEDANFCGCKHKPDEVCPNTADRKTCFGPCGNASSHVFKKCPMWKTLQAHADNPQHGKVHFVAHAASSSSVSSVRRVTATSPSDVGHIDSCRNALFVNSA